jgi:hemerythrin-like metal-binding protein
MPLIQWDESLSVGVEKLDAQHRRLAEMANALYEAVTAGNSREIVAELVARLTDYLREHFATEEGFMAAHGYPGAEGHKEQHAFFTRNVFDFEVAALDSYTPFAATFEFLRAWLADHTLDADKRLGAFLVSRGVR